MSPQPSKPSPQPSPQEPPSLPSDAELARAADELRPRSSDSREGDDERGG